jgi:hypothetical protein
MPTSPACWALFNARDEHQGKRQPQARWAPWKTQAMGEVVGHGKHRRIKHPASGSPTSI